MSEFSHEQDELASAYLDDAVTPAERAQVEADPALLARVEVLRSVHDALANPVVPPTTAERTAAIAAALGAATVIDIDINAARTQRRLRIASIAAAIVLVLGAAGVLVRVVDNGSDAKFTAVAGSVGSAADRSNAEQTAGGGAGTGNGGAFSTTGRPVLGSFSNRSSLAAATQTQVRDASLRSTQADTGSPSAAAGAPAPTAPVCLVPAPADSINEIYAATAVLEGRSVQVDVFTLADGSLVLVVTDAASCAQLFTQPV
jgi:hypothetical protein